MYQKILAPLDGSELSECTLSHLKAVASGCQIPKAVLLHVVQPIEEEYQHYQHRGIPEENIDQAEKDIEDHARDYLSKVADRMKKEGIRVIFVQKQFATHSAEAVANEIDGKVVILDPLAPDWLSNMKKIGETLKKAL